MDKREIIKYCIKKDEDAFRMLVEKYSDFTFSVAFRILNDEEESNDIVQETFISVWNKIDHFDIDKNFSNWLYRIIVNKCIDFLRRKKRMSLIHPDTNSWDIPNLFSESNPESNLNNKEIGKIIRMLTSKLSTKQKIVFILSELEGLTHDDISEITGMVKTSVKSNLNHARRNIKTMMEKIYLI